MRRDECAGQAHCRRNTRMLLRSPSPSIEDRRLSCTIRLLHRNDRIALRYPNPDPKEMSNPGKQKKEHTMTV